MIRFGIVKSTGQGEQVTIEVCDKNPFNGNTDYKTIQQMQQAVTEALHLSDERLQEMNGRMLAAYEFEKYCSQEQWTKIYDILEILAGRVNPTTILHRWQSSIEETAELERVRNEYANVPMENNNTTDNLSCGCCVGEHGNIILCNKHNAESTF